MPLSETPMHMYLKSLRNRYFHVSCMQRHLSDLEHWRRGERGKAFQRGASFFNWSSYALSRTLLVELAALLSASADRSLVNWLENAKLQVDLIRPTRCSVESLDRREQVTAEEYRKIVDAHLDRIKGLQHEIRQMKAHRDKTIAHFDKAYFENPDQIHQDYPLTKKDVQSLLNVVRDIIKEQYGYLFESDMDMEVHTAHTIDAVLEFTLGFIRAQEDSRLMEMGFEPLKYLPHMASARRRS